MKILSMTATFGQLDHATLRLEPGLNVIEAPNEWGKSTWCAFICAMLYGIDSRAHSATKAGLADKARYEPWSGQLMSGSMELLWEGRKVTIQRSSTKRAAFRQFQAFETDTGLPIPELTGENCGQMLLGVEKEVFVRSAFIRLADLPVTQNEALRRRLNSLVTTGDESSAGDLLSDRLTKLKNEIRANRSHGLLPQAEAKRQALADKLSQLEALRAELQRLEAEEQTLLAQTRADRATAMDSLSRLQQERAEVQAQMHILQAPAFLKPFLGLSPEEGAQQANADQNAYGEACAERRQPLRFLLSALPALLGLGALAIPHRIWLGLGIWLLGVAVSCLLIRQVRSRQRQAAATARALCQKYPDIAPEEWPQQVQGRLTRLQQLEHELSRLDGRIQALQNPEAHASGSDSRLLRENHLQKGRCQGRMDALGSEADLRAALARCDSRIRELSDKLSAIELALATLQEAKAQLQRRFAPRITGRAKALFSHMTGGRYDRLTLSEDLSLQTAAAREDILRSSLWRSEGTIDQLYLALRLAVSAELMPKSPLVLDDALVRFDDQRLKLAMEVLSEEAGSRQVILFTCQSRVKNCIQ